MNILETGPGPARTRLQNRRDWISDAPIQTQTVPGNRCRQASTITDEGPQTMEMLAQAGLPIHSAKSPSPRPAMMHGVSKSRR